MPRKLTGIRRKRNKWQANVRVRGHLYTKTFPLTTPVDEMRAWRDAQHVTFGGKTDALVAIEAKRLPRSLAGWCYVYFARSGAVVKIGRSVDPNQRIRELQTTHAGEIVLLACVGAHASLEGELHRRFEHLRTRVTGEWFRLEQDLLAFIWALQQGANPVELLFEDPRVVLGWYLQPLPKAPHTPEGEGACRAN